MIKLVSKSKDEGKKIFYLRKEDILRISEDDDGDVEIEFKELVASNELTIEQVTIEELERGLNDYSDKSEYTMVRDFY